MNMTKSLVNFDLTIDAQRVPRLQGSRFFPFCGNMIDTTTLDVIKDFTRMEGASIFSLIYTLTVDTIDTITVQRTQAPGKALMVKTLKIPQIRQMLTIALSNWKVNCKTRTLILRLIVCSLPSRMCIQTLPLLP